MSTRTSSGWCASGTRGPTAGAKSGAPPLLGCVVAAGRHAPLWLYEPPETPIHVPSVPERRDPDPLLASILDPSEEVVYHSLSDDATLHKTGRRTTVAGREALEARVGTVSWGYPPRIFWSFYAPEGTTDHLPLVDAEVGTILRVAARLEVPVAVGEPPSPDGPLRS
jgi:hypothetical protein